MPNWSQLIRHLRSSSGDEVTLAWTELQELVGDLPASAARYGAWWSGDRGHVEAWRSAGFTATYVQLGDRVSFARRPTTGSTESESAGDRGLSGRKPRPEAVKSAEWFGADLLLVACVQSKQSQPAAAKDLYISSLFRKQRRYAEQTGLPWYILSAEHGLVTPNQVLAPYELYLAKTPASYRAAWGDRVAQRLEQLAGPLHGKRVEVHAGSTYIKAVRPPLEALDAIVRDPLYGLRLGERSAWYNAQADESQESQTEMLDVTALVAILHDESRAMTPSSLLATCGADLRRPGLYSWSVDAAGAEELAQGLKLPLNRGLIYAGLAGATHWPSGKPSTNTLWSRIGGMHLGKSHEFSTFRRTLASLLVDSVGSSPVDEAALTSWMHDHLSVIATPYDDADLLGKAEKAMLKELDPPLNLQGMTPTPVRKRIKELRKALQG